MIDPHQCFDAAFAGNAPHLRIRTEEPDDAAFLTDLFIACSPLAEMLPRAMLEQQAGFQQAGYADAMPAAMRRIVSDQGGAIGRIIVDWRADESLGVDIAVLPDGRSTRAGWLMLRSWLDVADRLGLPATLHVRPDNRARLLYLKLGFEPVSNDAGWSPDEAMRRPARQSSAAG